MTIKTTLLPVEKARFVQDHCDKYGCRLIEISAAGNNEHTLKQSAKVTVAGEDENVKKLFEKIGE